MKSKYGRDEKRVHFITRDLSRTTKQPNKNLLDEEPKVILIRKLVDSQQMIEQVLQTKHLRDDLQIPDSKPKRPENWGDENTRPTTSSEYDSGVEQPHYWNMTHIIKEEEIQRKKQEPTLTKIKNYCISAKKRMINLILNCKRQQEQSDSSTSFDPEVEFDKLTLNIITEAI